MRRVLSPRRPPASSDRRPQSAALVGGVRGGGRHDRVAKQAEVDALRSRLNAALVSASRVPPLSHPRPPRRATFATEKDEDVDAGIAAIPVDIFFSQKRREAALQQALDRREDLKALHQRLADEEKNRVEAAKRHRDASKGSGATSFSGSRHSVAGDSHARFKEGLAKEVASLEARLRQRTSQLLQEMDELLSDSWHPRHSVESTNFMQTGSDPASILHIRRAVLTKEA